MRRRPRSLVALEAPEFVAVFLGVPRFRATNSQSLGLTVPGGYQLEREFGAEEGVSKPSGCVRFQALLGHGSVLQGE